MEARLKHAIASMAFVVVILLLTIILIAGRKQGKNDKSAISVVRSESFSDTQTRADSIVAFAKTLLGTKYVYTGCSPSGFDCSGFVYYVFRQFNIPLPHASYAIGEMGTRVDTSEARKGDLILFQGTDRSDQRIGHVGIVISEKGMPLEFIHASSNTKNSGIVITKLHSAHYLERFIKVVRVIPEG